MVTFCDYTLWKFTAKAGKFFATDYFVQLDINMTTLVKLIFTCNTFIQYHRDGVQIEKL